VSLPVQRRLLLVRGLRAFADGYVSLLLPIYLIALGMSPLQVGIIATATLLGSGLLTMVVGLHAHRFSYRASLLAASALMTLTGIAFIASNNFWPLVLVAFVGTLNPSSGDVSVFLPLEHAALSQTVADRDRTALFARYSIVGALLAALGSLAAGLPDLIVESTHASMMLALQCMFGLYATIGIVSALVYRSLPVDTSMTVQGTASSLGKSKKLVYVLAALFSLDAFGGGLVVQAMVALWLFQKYALSVLFVGQLFFWTGLLSAFSYLAAVRISSRFGLLNTMVFTHLPSSVFLILIPFMPSLNLAIALLLARALLSQMDVPTRSSYVMAIVSPSERAAAASVTSVPRSLAAAVGPLIAGYLLGISTFGWPLVIAGGLKIVYDLLLLRTFHKVRPPEELQLGG
jgi:MFS family permease